MDSKKRNKRGVTSSSTRSARSKAGSSDAAKKTTSSGRGAGRTPTVDNRSQRQRASNPKVTQGRTNQGLAGSRTKAKAGLPSNTAQTKFKPNPTSTAKVTRGRGSGAGSGPNRADAQKWGSYNQSARKELAREAKQVAPGTKNAQKNATPTGPRNPNSQIAANKMKRTLAQSAEARASAARAGTLAKAGKVGGLATVAAAGLQSRNTADGTLKGKPTGPKQGPKVPGRLTQKGIDSKSFDDAFRQARKAGQKQFTWKGKSYTTKMK